VELVARGTLWIKPFHLSSVSVVESSNCFRKMHVNIHNGSLDIYRDENVTLPSFSSLTPPPPPPPPPLLLFS
jgi:hypothetical protein